MHSQARMRGLLSRNEAKNPARGRLCLLPSRRFAKPAFGRSGVGSKKNAGTGYDALTFVNYMIRVSPLSQAPADPSANRAQIGSVHGIL